LRFKPFLAFRDSNSLVVENQALNGAVQEEENGVSTCLYEGFPRLYMQFSRRVEWVSTPDWYRGIEYVKDLERGVPYSEDLWVPGYFEVPIKKGESIIFSAGTSPVKPRSLSRMYEGEIAHRTPRTSFFNCLKNAAKQFYLRDGDKMYVLSGYPWGVILARNTFMAAPGLTLPIDHDGDFEKIMETGLAALNHYYETRQKDSRIQGIDLPDIALWAIRAIQQYDHKHGREKTRAMYADSVYHLVNAIIDGAHPNLRVDAETGLIATNGTHTPASWMNSMLYGEPVIPRTGLLVEFNALWYNALCYASALASDNDNLIAQRERWDDLSSRLKDSFVSTFLNEHGYLYDYVNGDNADLSVRPNMAVAIGLDYCPLDRRQRRSVLDVVTRELLTPKGLRTLSPRSYGYRPFYLGSPEERELALHQGPARPWLMGFYADAYLNVFKASGVHYIDRMLIGFEDEMSTGCIGSLSQLYDGNPPFNGRGAISHATNVAEVLRTLTTIKNFDI
jgi:predicted glycogen debranching enzyme